MTYFFNPLFEAGFRLTDGSQLNDFAAHPRVSSDDGVVASGTTVADAARLAAVINVVTVTPAAAGVFLPRALPGMEVFVFNEGDAETNVYGFLNPDGSTDTVDGAASVVLTNALRCGYYCYAPGKWLSAQLGAASA